MSSVSLPFYKLNCLDILACNLFPYTSLIYSVYNKNECKRFTFSVALGHINTLNTQIFLKNFSDSFLDN